MTGWGPALGMAFAFSAFADLQQVGASAWRAALGWSLAGAAVGQMFVFVEWAPSFLTGSQAQTIGGLGAFVFAIAIRMAGAILEYKERAEAQARRPDRGKPPPPVTTRNAARRTTARWSRTRPKEFSTVAPDGRIGSFNAAAEVDVRLDRERDRR